MTRRDGITIAAITVFALGAALVLQGLFKANQDSGGAEAPQLPRTAVLPDPPAAKAPPVLLRVRVADAQSGARIEDGVVLRFSYGQGGDMVAFAYGGSAGSDILLTKAPGGALTMSASRPRYLSPAPVQVHIEPGKTSEASLEMERLHPLTIHPLMPGGGLPPLLGLARVAPLPKWPTDRPFIQWVEPVGDKFLVELPAGRYVCCVPQRDLSRDEHGRAWVSAAQLNGAGDFVIPAPCLFTQLQVDGSATLEPAFVALPARGEVSGRVLMDAAAAPWEVVELVSIGPGPFRSVAAEVLSGKDGTFRFSGVAPGAYEARVRDVAGAGKHFELSEAALSAQVEIVMPAPGPGSADKPATIRMMVLRNGQPLSGASMVLLGAGAADDDWRPALPGTVVGNPTGHPGVVEWRGARDGWHYELTAWPRTAASVKVGAHGDTTARVVLETAPEGTGALKMPVQAPDTWFEVISDEGKSLALVTPDLDGLIEVWGIPAGLVSVRLYRNSVDTREAGGTIVAGQTTTVVWPAIKPAEDARPPEEAPKAPEVPAPPDPPKQEPPKNPEPPPEPPKQAPDAEDRENQTELAHLQEKPDDPPDPSNKPDAHDRPTGHVKIRLPAPSHSPGYDPAWPHMEFLDLAPAGLPPTPAYPRPLKPLGGASFRILLDVDASESALWQTRVTLRSAAGETTVALFETCAPDSSKPNVEIRAGLCSSDGRAAIVLAGALEAVEAARIAVPGYSGAELALVPGTGVASLSLRRR